MEYRRRDGVAYRALLVGVGSSHRLPRSSAASERLDSSFRSSEWGSRLLLVIALPLYGLACSCAGPAHLFGTVGRSLFPDLCSVRPFSQTILLITSVHVRGGDEPAAYAERQATLGRWRAGPAKHITGRKPRRIAAVAEIDDSEEGTGGNAGVLRNKSSAAWSIASAALFWRRGSSKQSGPRGGHGAADGQVLDRSNVRAWRMIVRTTNAKGSRSSKRRYGPPRSIASTTPERSPGREPRQQHVMGRSHRSHEWNTGKSSPIADCS